LKNTTWEKDSREEAFLDLLVTYDFYKSLTLLNLNPSDEIVAGQEHQLESCQ
jgi:hypothetical protein